MAIHKLLYTGLFGKKDKSEKPKEMLIDGECTIANYDTRDNVKPNASIKIVAKDKSIFLVEENNNDTESLNVADLSEKKAKALEEVAKLDTSDSGLSKKDIQKITQENKDVYIKKWGLVDLKVDPNNGVLTLKWGEKDILRIDFSQKRDTNVETKNGKGDYHVVQSGDTLTTIASKYGVTVKEILEANKGINPDMLSLNQKIIIPKKGSEAPSVPKASSAETIKKSANQEETSTVHIVVKGDTLAAISKKYNISVKNLIEYNDLKNPDQLKLGQVLKLTADAKVEDNKSTSKSQNEGVKTDTSKAVLTTQQCYKKLYAMIPKEYDSYIARTAKNAGVSEDLVRFIILSEGEAGTRKAKLESYKCSSGVWTIGFGHTNNCRKDDEIFGEGKKITLDEAFDILEKDIIEMKRLTIHYVTEERFNGLPESIQSLCIDYYFQVGNGNKFKGQNFCDNADGEIYGPLAAGSLYRGGDLRRTANAFMLAVKGLSVEDQKAAVTSLKNKGYYDKIIKELGGAEKFLFKNFCSSILS